MSNPKSVIFDLDGTLVDSLPGISASVRYAAIENLPGTSVPDLDEYIGPPIKEILRKSLGVTEAVKLSQLEQSFRRHYDATGYKETRLFEGIRMVLDSLRAKSIKCYLLTNKPLAPTMAILELLELGPYFAEVVTPDCRATPFHNKSDAAIYLKGKLQSAPEEVVVVGDSLDDYHAAMNCGFMFCGAMYGYGALEEIMTTSPCVRLYAPADLLLWIENKFNQ